MSRFFITKPTQSTRDWVVKSMAALARRAKIKGYRNEWACAKLFLTEEGIYPGSSVILFSELYDIYKERSEFYGFIPISKKSFSAFLKASNFIIFKGGQNRTFVGFTIKD